MFMHDGYTCWILCYIKAIPSRLPFSIKMSLRRVEYGAVSLLIEDNYGEPLFTCLYRFRVHGTPASTGWVPGPDPRVHQPRRWIWNGGGDVTITQGTTKVFSGPFRLLKHIPGVLFCRPLFFSLWVKSWTCFNVCVLLWHAVAVKGKSDQGGRGGVAFDDFA